MYCLCWLLEAAISPMPSPIYYTYTMFHILSFFKFSIFSFCHVLTADCRVEIDKQTSQTGERLNSNEIKQDEHILR